MMILLAALYLIPLIAVSMLVVRLDAEDGWMGIAVLPVINLIVLVALISLTIAMLKIRRDYE